MSLVPADPQYFSKDCLRATGYLGPSVLWDHSTTATEPLCLVPRPMNYQMHSWKLLTHKTVHVKQTIMVVQVY